MPADRYLPLTLKHLLPLREKKVVLFFVKPSQSKVAAQPGAAELLSKTPLFAPCEALVSFLSEHEILRRRSCPDLWESAQSPAVCPGLSHSLGKELPQEGFIRLKEHWPSL